MGEAGGAKENLLRSGADSLRFVKSPVPTDNDTPMPRRKHCSHCLTRKATHHVCYTPTGTFVDLCEACYRAVTPRNFMRASEQEDRRLSALLARGKCRFCGKPTAGGSLFPGGSSSLAEPEKYLWCRACIRYLEEFRRRPEGRIREGTPANLNDARACEAIRRRMRRLWRRLEAFIRKRVSDRRGKRWRQKATRRRSRLRAAGSKGTRREVILDPFWKVQVMRKVRT